MINILHFIDHYRVGGPGKTIINSARFIDRGKFRIHVGTFASQGEDLTEFQKFVQCENIPLLTLPDRRGFEFKTLKRLYSYVTEKSINILHSHGYKSDIYGFLIKCLRPTMKLVTTQHGWITNNRFQKLYIQLDFLIFRFFDGVILVSEEMLKKLPSSTTRRVPCTVIHNALVLSDYSIKDNRAFIRTELKIGDEEIVIGVIGRLSPEKGCFDMLRSFSLLHNGMDIGVKLIFVGEGVLREKLEQRIAQLSLNESVILAGYRNPIQPVYEALDILVCPSQTEGLSNVILEAFAYRLPVAATAVGGNTEIIRDGHNGLLVTKGDLEGLRAALETLIKSSALRSDLGNRGYETLLESFTFGRRIRRVESFYESILLNDS
jgi:glycosyltransferase involved in cell wall biosynthesis